jgi:hypothetical protein
MHNRRTILRAQAAFEGNIYHKHICTRHRDAPDTVFAGYPANPKAGYRISGRILELATIFLVK